MTWAETPRWVTGMPGRRRHGRQRRDARHDLERRCRPPASASASSPPRPKTNGSPPLRRTTSRPERPSSTSSVVQLGLAELLARDHERVVGRLVDELGRDEHVVDERVAGADSSRPCAVIRPGIAGAGADEADGHESRSVTSSSK